MNKGEKQSKSFKICDVTQLGPNLKKSDHLGLYYIASEINLCYSSYIHFVNAIYFVLVIEGPSWKSVFLVCK